MKLGATASLTLGMNEKGDLVISLVDSEKLSDQTLSWALHPSALGDELVSLLGGASWVKGIVALLLSELPLLAPKA